MSVFNRISLASLALSLALIPGGPALAGPAGPDGHHGHESHGHAHQHEAGPEDGRVYTTTGLVVALHPEDNKLTITHEAIPALGWPRMTMRFSVEDPALLEEAGPGDRVRLDFRNQDGQSIIVDLEAL